MKPRIPPQTAHLLPPVLAAFLSCLFIVIRPLAALSPPYAFLILTIQILYFYPSGTLIAQIESSALAFVGALLSLGYANLFLYFAVLANRAVPGTGEGDDSVGIEAESRESVWARVACALGLAVLAVATGWVRSKSPRLMNAARIVLFHGVWLLVDTSNIQKMSGSYFLNLFYPTLFSMLLSLFSSAVGHFLLPPAQSTLRDVLHDAVETLRHEIEEQVKGALPQPERERVEVEPGLPEPVEEARMLDRPAGKSLPALLPVLRNLYNARRHSITHAPVSPVAIRPFLTLLSTRIGRNPVAKGAGRGMHDQFARGQAVGHGGAFTESLPVLAETMGRALGVCADAVDDVYAWDGAGRKEWNLPALTKRLAGKNTGARDEEVAADGGSRTRLRAIKAELETAITAYEADLLLWLDTDVFAPSANGKCPVARVSLADVPSSVTRTMFEHRLADRAGEKSRMRKAHEARLRATSWLVAMLDLSADILQLVAISKELLDKADLQGFKENGKRRSRIWLPRLGKHWLMKAPSKGRLVDDMGASNSAVQRHAELESAVREEGEDSAFIAQHQLARTLTRDNRERHLEQQERNRRDDAPNASEYGELKEEKPRIRRWDPVHRFKRLELRAKLWWTSERSLQRRIRLSKWLASAKHSMHNHYAFKMALGVMLLSLPGYLPLGSAGRSWFTDARGQWAVISYLYVLDITTGATFRVGIWRLIGTLSGAVVGYVGYLIARGTPYGLTAIATIASLPIAWIMLYSTYPGVGIVAGITLPPILFIPYLRHDSYSEVIIVALWRAEQVAVGIIGAFLVNSFVFPYHARVRYFHCLATTLDKLAELYLTMSRDLFRPSLVYTGNVERYTALEQNIEAGIGQCQSLAQIQHLEVSLLPKPYKLHSRLNALLKNILEVLVDIRTVRLSIPRRETVLDVIPLRQDIVSSVYITLFAVAHASRSRSPLPQFLPSPRDALNKWGRAVEKLLGESRPPSGTQSPVVSEADGSASPRRMVTPSAMDLAALYAFAEREALSRLCDILDETVEYARELFGVQAFLTPQIVPTRDQEEDL